MTSKHQSFKWVDVNMDFRLVGLIIFFFKKNSTKFELIFFFTKREGE